MKHKGDRSCVRFALNTLKILDHHLKNQIQATQLDLRFLKMFLWGLEHWKEGGSRKDSHPGCFVSVLTMIENTFRLIDEELKARIERKRRGAKIRNRKVWVTHFSEKIKLLKPQLIETCVAFLSGSAAFERDEPRPTYARGTIKFIDFILVNLGLLQTKLKTDPIAPVQQQIGFIRGKLELFQEFFHLFQGSMMIACEEVDQVLLETRTWVDHISCLACLYWTSEMDESLASAMGTMLFDLMRKTMPPKVVVSYLKVLEATRNFDSEEWDRLRKGTSRFSMGPIRFPIFQAKVRNHVPRIGTRYIEFLLESLDIPIKDEADEIICEGLTFLYAFAMDPPEKVDSQIWGNIIAIISEVTPVLFSIGLEGRKALFDLLEKIDTVKANVGELYVLIPHSSEFNFPRTSTKGLVSFLLGNLKKMSRVQATFAPFLKHRALAVLEELGQLLRPLLRNELEEFKDFSTRIVNLVYYADYVFSLFSVDHVSLWYSILCLSKLMEEMKILKIEAKKIEDELINSSKKLITAEMGSTDDGALPPCATTSRIEGVFVGFKEDVQSIRNHLLRGRKELTIVSISGMPGQGKTTLAKRIYNDPSTQCYFSKILWCYVSKQCKMRELLIKIVQDVSKDDAETIRELENHVLAERLWRSLRKQRYLIVLDDIWDVDLWREVERSFPDDSNGSRILFTSRNHDLASQAKPNSIPFPLRSFSDEESWELMKEKIFPSAVCPSEFSKLGKQIAIYCKGLPLAVALMASLLGRTEKTLELWKQVAKNLKSHLASEGCMNIIELSYNYLPDHLKACLLYFGAFPRGKDILAKELKLLWVAEGFINYNEMQLAEDLAEKYLENLVSQSLVTVTKRRYNGGVRVCNVHDLVYDMCVEKAVEENFLGFADKNVVDEWPFSLQKYDHYRLCVHTSDPLAFPSPIRTREELPTCQVHSLTLYDWGIKDSYVLEGFKILNVLNIRSSLWNFPEAILSMVQLRYLNINRVDDIPPSIVDLCNLETLIVQDVGGLIFIPESVLKMKSLRHLRLCGHTVFEKPVLEEASDGGYNIETLGCPYFRNGSESENLLRKLTKLRKLSCFFGEEYRPRCAGWLLMFKSLNKLESLKIAFAWSARMGAHFSKLPALDFLPENLRKLTLRSLHLRWSAMATVGKMPNLVVLKLEHACKGRRWSLEDGDFSKLRLLTLRDLDIQQINVSSDPFPSLEELVFDSCYELEEIPPAIGDICNLRSIKLIRCNKASDSAMQILEEQRHFGNDILKVQIENAFEDEDEDEFEEDEFDEFGDGVDSNDNSRQFWTFQKKTNVHRSICSECSQTRIG